MLIGLVMGRSSHFTGKIDKLEGGDRKVIHLNMRGREIREDGNIEREGEIKGTVQRQLTGVESGTNR